MTTPSVTSAAEWRWDRFDAKKVTSVAWASRNCVGHDSHLPEAHQAMQGRVLQDEKAAGRIIASKLHLLLHDGANITGMTYRCKLTQQTLACINSKDIRLAWMQDGGEENLKRLAWIFYFYGTEVHRSGKSYHTHGEWVEREVMSALNITYVHLSELPIGQRTCLQQLYAKKFNDLRTNIMRRGSAIQHKSMVKKEQPRVAGMFQKNFKRAKTTFFVSLNVGREEDWRKVSSKHRTQNKTVHVTLTKLVIQVDYATDTQWNRWCEKALLQLLQRPVLAANGSSSVSTLGNSEIRVPESTNKSIPDTWYHPRQTKPILVTPASYQGAQDEFGQDLMCGAVTQKVALEDGVWDNNIMVSHLHGRGGATCMNTHTTRGNDVCRHRTKMVTRYWPRVTRY